MLTQHTYFNLDAFANPSTDLIWNHTLSLPYSRRLLGFDSTGAPDGTIPSIPKNDINDFWSQPHQLGFADTRPGWQGNCAGTGCVGYNNEWVVDSAKSTDIVASLSSDWSGIKADLQTDQRGIVIYTAYWMDGSIPIKSTQGWSGSDGFVQSGGTVAIEAQDWSAGINNPEWGREKAQITGPGETYTWEGTWTFGRDFKGPGQAFTHSSTAISLPPVFHIFKAFNQVPSINSSNPRSVHSLPPKQSIETSVQAATSVGGSGIICSVMNGVLSSTIASLMWRRIFRLAESP